MVIESRNPATLEVVESFPEFDGTAIHRAVARSVQAFETWRSVPFNARAVPVRKLATLLRERRHEMGILMAVEMGKPIGEGEAEADKCAWVCEYYADNAERILSAEPVETDAMRSYIRFDPLGPILAVMPWNFPFWQVFRFAAPALMAGNTALLKHASNVPRCAMTIAELFAEAGFPPGSFLALLISSDSIESVLRRPEVRAVTLTGSEGAGMSIAGLAAKYLKKAVLELGGSDPFIVLEDVDVPAVARWAAKARVINSGQSCIAAKRFLVVEPVADRFVEAFRAELEAVRVGDPLDPATQVGPLAREDLLIALDRQVADSVAQGAVLVTGGRRLERTGYYYAPTLLDRVRPGMAAFEHETFGPVAAVTRVLSEEEAVRDANASRYGLGASIWSGDPARAERLVPKIDAGCVFVNGMVKSDPRLPFGGVKMSGYGRELAGYGIKEFVNIKSVWVGPAAVSERPGGDGGGRPTE